MTGTIWLTKLLLSHLLTDFILQPGQWIRDRNEKHFVSVKLYLHGVITALSAWLFTGGQYWGVALIIFVSHILIDAWKSYRPRTIDFFIADQLMHGLVILACWYFNFMDWSQTRAGFMQLNADRHIWIVATAFVFVTAPAGILIGEMTGRWRDKLDDPDQSLANAGKWIGIAERIIVLILVMHNQYSAIGLLVTAKGIIRFNEKDRQELKTEYLVIGTLLSIGIAIVTGLLTKM